MFKHLFSVFVFRVRCKLFCKFSYSFFICVSLFLYIFTQKNGFWGPILLYIYLLTARGPRVFYIFLRVILHRKKNNSRHADCCLHFDAVGALAAPASPTRVEPASATATATPISTGLVASVLGFFPGGPSWVAALFLVLPFPVSLAASAQTKSTILLYPSCFGWTGSAPQIGSPLLSSTGTHKLGFTTEKPRSPLVKRKSLKKFLQSCRPFAAVRQTPCPDGSGRGPPCCSSWTAGTRPGASRTPRSSPPEGARRGDSF